MADLVIQDFDEDVKRQMKFRALEKDMTLKAAVEDACREWVKKK